ISSLFFFTDTATTQIYTLSLHDALPISPDADDQEHRDQTALEEQIEQHEVERREGADHERFQDQERHHVFAQAVGDRLPARHDRSEEHTSELQSQSNLVCRLLLEKKKKK